MLTACGGLSGTELHIIDFFKKVGTPLPGIVLGACFYSVASGNSLAAPAPTVPDASRPGGAQAGQDYSIAVPPSEVSNGMVLPPPKVTSASPGGARITVKHITLAGVIDRPEHGISVQELTEQVERLRQQRLTPADSLTLRQLQEIAANVAQYYRERGLFLTQVLVPPQTVVDDTVQILVMEGILGQVQMEKNQNYDAGQLQQPFRALIGRPVSRQEIEAAMLLINDYPGLSAFAVFRPGINTGETDLLISVLEEKRIDARVQADNFGSAYTGEYRGRLRLRWNNPFGAADRITASLSKTYRPNNGSYGALTYERRAFGAKNTVGFGISQNAYELGGKLASFGFEGSTRMAQVFWRRVFHRSRLINSYGSLQLSRKSARLDVMTGEDRADELTVLTARTGLDWSSASRRHMGRGSLSYSQGFEGLLGAMKATNDPSQTEASRRGGSKNYAGGKFSKWNLDYQQWLTINREHQLHFSLRAQQSGELLTSLEQMPIGGPNSVRAYATAEWLRDTAVTTSIEWLISAPGFADWPAFGQRRWGELLKAVMFVDYAKGWLNDPLSSDREVVSLSGIGVGLRFHYQQLSSRFEIATPLGSEKVSNGRDPQYYFELSYGF